MEWEKSWILAGLCLTAGYALGNFLAAEIVARCLAGTGVRSLGSGSQCDQKSWQGGGFGGSYRRHSQNNSGMLVLLSPGSTGIGRACHTIWWPWRPGRACVAFVVAWPGRWCRTCLLHLADTVFANYRSAVLPGGGSGGSWYRKQLTGDSFDPVAGGAGGLAAVWPGEWGPGFGSGDCIGLAATIFFSPPEKIIRTVKATATIIPPQMAFCNRQKITM